MEAEDRHIDRPPDYVLTFRKACELIEKYGMDTGEMFTYNQVTALMIEFASEYARQESIEFAEENQTEIYENPMNIDELYDEWIKTKDNV